MKAKIKTYRPPTNGYKLTLGFEDVTTIRMALENKLRHDRNQIKTLRSQNSKNFWRKEARYAIKALRGVLEKEMYVD